MKGTNKITKFLIICNILFSSQLLVAQESELKTNAALSCNDKYYAVGGNKTIELWDYTSKSRLWSKHNLNNKLVKQISFSCDNNIVFVLADKIFYAFEVKSGKILKESDLSNETLDYFTINPKTNKIDLWSWGPYPFSIDFPVNGCTTSNIEIELKDHKIITLKKDGKELGTFKHPI